MSVLKYFALIVALSLPAFPQARAGSYLGVSVAESANTEQGVPIVRVTPDSPAAKAGLKPGDILLSYNGETIMGPQQLGRLVWETSPGRHIKVQYIRDGKTATLTVTTGSPPIPVHSVGTDPQTWDAEITPEIPVPSICWRNLAIGIEYEPVTAQLASAFGVSDGLLVRQVQLGSAAEKAGVRAGDVIIDVNGHGTTDHQDLVTSLRIQSSSDRPITLNIVRAHKHLALLLKPIG